MSALRYGMATGTGSASKSGTDCLRLLQETLSLVSEYYLRLCPVFLGLAGKAALVGSEMVSGS